LAETEHQVFYVRLQKGPHQAEECPVPTGIEQVQWAGGRGEFHWRDLPRLVSSFQRLFHKIHPDVVHAGPIQTCGLIATLAGASPRLIMSWGFDLMQDAYRNAWWKGVTRYTLRRAAFFTSDCQATRERAVAFGMDPRRTIVFPWGVDLEHFSPPDGPRRTSKDFIVMCNRSWEPRYGVDILAKAFVKAASQHEGLSLLLLNGGSQASALHRIFENGGASHRVTFPGWVSQSDLPQYYRMADLYVSPSHVDGSSVSLMEALASGAPCLVSDIPANKEWIEDGVNGWLFPDGDVDALSVGMIKAAGTRETLRKMGESARHTAEAQADWKKNFQKLLEAYQETLGKYDTHRVRQ